MFWLESFKRKYCARHRTSSTELYALFMWILPCRVRSVWNLLTRSNNSDNLYNCHYFFQNKELFTKWKTIRNKIWEPFLRVCLRHAWDENGKKVHRAVRKPRDKNRYHADHLRTKNLLDFDLFLFVTGSSNTDYLSIKSNYCFLPGWKTVQRLLILKSQWRVMVKSLDIRTLTILILRLDCKKKLCEFFSRLLLKLLRQRGTVLHTIGVTTCNKTQKNLFVAKLKREAAKSIEIF